jgi:hypothetical protein
MREGAQVSLNASETLIELSGDAADAIHGWIVM